MLLVQEYLMTHTFGDLAREHGVYASFSKSGHKFSLNYDQIEAKEADLLAQECRGLVLACQDGRVLPSEVVNGKTVRDSQSPGATKILAYPMKRFFNYGQGSAVSIDWSDPKLAVLEKLDGTLCIVYHDPFTSKWCVATRSVPEADLLMDNGIFTFRTLFEKALTETTGYDFNLGFPKLLEIGYTYCFELTTPYNRIVVNYPNNGITLLAVRNTFTLQEVGFDHPVVEKLMPRVPMVQEHTHTTMEELLNWVSSLNPMDHEGVVIRQGEGRIKVKNAAYVAYNKVRDTLATSARNCVELILAEKDDDVVSFLPEEIVKNLHKIKEGVQQAIKVYDEAYADAVKQTNATNPGDKKTFAILVTQNKKLWSAPFFHMFGGKSSSMKDFIAKNKKEGTWADGFLDKILEISNYHQ
jgi:RNA ligase